MCTCTHFFLFIVVIKNRAEMNNIKNGWKPQLLICLEIDEDVISTYSQTINQIDSILCSKQLLNFD
jgi:hypothetical protein